MLPSQFAALPLREKALVMEMIDKRNKEKEKEYKRMKARRGKGR